MLIYEKIYQISATSKKFCLLCLLPPKRRSRRGQEITKRGELYRGHGQRRFRGPWVLASAAAEFRLKERKES